MKNPLLLLAFVLCIGVLISAKANVTVRLRDIQYQPANVQIKVDDSVTWINADDRDHTVVATDNSFNSGNLKPGQSYTHVFTTAGSFSYGCTYHPRMMGTVQVGK